MLTGSVGLEMGRHLQVQLNISTQGGWGVTGPSGWGDVVRSVLVKALWRSWVSGCHPTGGKMVDHAGESPQEVLWIHAFKAQLIL